MLFGHASLDFKQAYVSPRYSQELGNLGRKFTVHTDGAPQLWLLFPIVSLRGKYKEQPEAYIHYAMNHYGQGKLDCILVQTNSVCLPDTFCACAFNSVCRWSQSFAEA